MIDGRAKHLDRDEWVLESVRQQPVDLVAEAGPVSDLSLLVHQDEMLQLLHLSGQSIDAVQLLLHLKVVCCMEQKKNDTSSRLLHM